MRKALLLLVGLLAIAGATTPATAQRSSVVNVSITSIGFDPDDVLIKPGDTVTWKNNDSSDHQVVADTGAFKSPVLRPGASYSFRFQTEASYSYHDAMKPSMTGTVNSVEQHPTVGLTRRFAVYGNSVRVFGSIPSNNLREQVTVRITPYRGQERTRTVFTNDGVWEFTYTPKMRTQFSATWDGTPSNTAPEILVRPLVVFSTLNADRNRFSVRLRPAASYAYKLVRIQRLNNKGLWRTTTRVRLNRYAFRRFRGNFSRGATKARAWVSSHPGYTVGFSPTKTIVR